MKCVIVSNGIDFRIKKRTFLIWKYIIPERRFIGKYKKPDWFEYPIEFESFSDAIEFLKLNYGTTYELINVDIYQPVLIDLTKI